MTLTGTICKDLEHGICSIKFESSHTGETISAMFDMRNPCSFYALNYNVTMYLHEHFIRAGFDHLTDSLKIFTERLLRLMASSLILPNSVLQRELTDLCNLTE